MKLETIVSPVLSPKRALALAGAAAVVALGTGCETKSFLDPSEVGRYEKTPLVVPILDKLVVGVEAEEVQYASARDVTAEDQQPTNRDYRVGPNDLLQYSIQDLNGQGTMQQDNKRVSESGKMSLPYLGQISVVGMTESEVEDAIVRAYAEAQILPKAIVSVSVVESQNRIYNISGAIVNAGPYPLLRGDLRLLDAVSNARGVTSEMGIEYVYIIRHKVGASSNNSTTPAAAPGAPGADPLAPQSALPMKNDRPVFAMRLQEQPAPPQTPEEARAAAEKLAKELNQTPSDAATPAPGSMTPADEAAQAQTNDRVIQIEGAGTQPASPGEVTTIPPSMTDNTAAPMAASPAAFEFTAPAEPTDQEIIKIPFGLLKRGELKYNIVIQPQDSIIVPFPQSGTYVMGGHILRGGAYSLPPDGMTIKQAVMAAGGLDQLAIPARTDVTRRLGPNQEVIVRVDLERIFTGLEPDVYLKNQDTINVGTNFGASFVAALRNAFRITYGFGFLYDRNYAPNNNNNN